MDLDKVEWEYDGGHGSDSKFSNLPPEKQKWWKEYVAQCEALNAEQDKKESPNKKGMDNQ